MWRATALEMIPPGLLNWMCNVSGICVAKLSHGVWSLTSKVEFLFTRTSTKFGGLSWEMNWRIFDVKPSY